MTQKTEEATSRRDFLKLAGTAAPAAAVAVAVSGTQVQASWCNLQLTLKIWNHAAFRSSSSQTTRNSSPSIPFAVGTRFTDPCTPTIAFTKADVAHFKWHTKSCERPGLTNACVTMRISHFPTPDLHALHVAGLVGACPIVYVLGRVLSPAVRPIARPCPNT